MTTWKDGLPAPARAILRSAEEDDVDDLMHDRMKKRLAGALVASAAVAGATTAAAGASSATSTATVAMGAGASSVAPAAGAAVVKGIGGAVAAKWIGVATLALVSASAAVTFVAPKPSPTEDRMAVEAPLGGGESWAGSGGQRHSARRRDAGAFRGWCGGARRGGGPRPGPKPIAKNGYECSGSDRD